MTDKEQTVLEAIKRNPSTSVAKMIKELNFQGIYRTGDQRTEKKADDYSRRACQKWQMDCIEIKGRGFKILEKRHDHDVKDCAFFHELI